MSRKIALFSLAFVAFAFSASATRTEAVTINTSSLPAGTKGFLDFLYNGGINSPTATTTIAGFSSTGTLDATSISRTNATGQLPAGVAITNNNAEYLEGITFGSAISFQLIFGEPAYNSIFTLSLLNSTQDGSFLTSDVNDGYLFKLSIDGQGNITPTTYTTETGSPSVVTLSALTGVPEPSTFYLFGLAAAVLFVAASRTTL